MPEYPKTRLGSISNRVTQFVFLAIMTALPLAGSHIISLALADMHKLVETAEKTEIKDLKNTLNGMAWVQARFEPAASESVLVHSGHKCLWKQHETRKQETENVYSDGKWSKKRVTRIYRDPPEMVPARLVSSDTEILLTSWKNIEMSAMLQNSPANTEAEAQTSSNASDTSEVKVVYYLPAGSNAWVFGNFVNGQPVGTEELPVRLSAGNREQFIEKTLENQGLLKILQTILNCVGTFFALVALFIMMRMGKAFLDGQH